MKTRLHFLSEWLGIEFSPVSHAERLASTLGGVTGIALVGWVTLQLAGPDVAMLMVASMGASAVLLFAVPHGPLSQPWALIGGHALSAIVGVTTIKLLGTGVVPAAIAVGLAIGVMHYARCLHPPGGATALTFAIGGPTVQALGYDYVLIPVLLNAGIMLATAVAFNALFHWRRYPVALARLRGVKPAAPGVEEAEYMPMTHEDFAYALKEMDSFIDVTEADMKRIYALAREHARGVPLQAAHIRLGDYYTNGRFGAHWAVRQVVDESRSDDPAKDKVIYKIVAGEHRRASGVCTRTEFANWARHRVERDNNTWHRVGVQD
jgi:CBS-domain-containing membrane protein